ncbi:MAG: GAF domain-containing protein [Chloroflexi bacterium]|nr:GAF domain-containing protein [Chloroflexota bacterium]
MSVAHVTTATEPQSVFVTEARYGIPAKWGLLAGGALALMLAVGPAAPRLPGAELWTLVAYALANVLFTLLFALRPGERRRPRARHLWLALSYITDYAFVAALVYLTGGWRSELYLLFGLLAIKSAVYYPRARQLVWITYTPALLWPAVSLVEARSPFFLTDAGYWLRYGLLAAWIIACVVIGWLMQRRQESIAALGDDLQRKSRDIEAQTRVVQRSAAELANRLLELRSLQESAKAITGALALDELLQLVVENATQVLRGARCTVALVDEHGAVATLAAAGVPQGQLAGASFRVGEGVAGWVVQNRRPALIPDVNQDERFVPVLGRNVGSLVSVPLISQGQVIGALTATAEQRAAFGEDDVDLLDAFADQAVIAVKNARLYAELLAEEQETARLYQSVLEKSNELEAVLRGIGDAVIFVDPQLQLLMMNPVAAQLFGLLQAPQPGVRLPDLAAGMPEVSEQLLALVEETQAEAVAPGASAALVRELTLPGQGERNLIYQALASSVRGVGDETRGVVMVMRDVTAQREIDRIKSDFLSVVSHELRTPLHSIKGFVDIILMGKTGEINELQRDFLTTVKEATTNLQRLINDLLEFSRMEAGQIKLKPEMISLYDAAQAVVEQLAPLAQEGQLTLSNAVAPDIAQVEADRARIEQVITNLVSNAIKFTPAGGAVTVTADDLGEQVRVAVADTGIGIAEDELPRVFQRFYQVDGSATRSYRGTGLGLTICKFIVEYHSGRIWAESTVGRGSTFYFALPKTLPSTEDLVIDFTTSAAQRSAEGRRAAAVTRRAPDQP